MWTKKTFQLLTVGLVLSTACIAQIPSDTDPSATDCALRPDAPGCQSQDTGPLQRPTVAVPQAPVSQTQQQGTDNSRDLNPKNTDGQNPNQLPNQQVPPAASTTSPPANVNAESLQTNLKQEEPRNDFQNFVEISLGKRLPLFGYSLFRTAPTTFAPADRIPITGDYVIGPGDELMLNVWGQVTLTARLIVDREGNVNIPRVGPVNVAGAHYNELHDRLNAAIGHYYKNFQISVSVGRLRSIQVYVTGFAQRPGNYTVSSLATLVNALFASGGPSPQGSMRAIQVKRNGSVVTQFDLYDFLLRGDKSKDVPLQPEDVIYIPAVGPLVAIAGAVNVPAIYEAKQGSTLSDGIDIAGGLSTVADANRVTIERIDRRKARSVVEVPLDPQAMKMELNDGDIVRVVPLSPKIENAVVLRGNIALPGRYPYRAGMRIRDLIPNREFLLTPDFWKAQVAVKEHDPYVSPESKINPTLGTPNNPNPTTQKQRANGEPAQRNTIRLSAPEINWDYAVVQRINPVDLSTHLVPFNLGKALAGDDAANVTLMPGDIVTVFSQRDIAVPRDEQSRFATVEGEVRAAGVYRIEPGDTLRSILRRAGGVTTKAYLFGTLLTRESAREEQQKMLDETTQSLSGQVQQRASSDSAGHPEDSAAITMRTNAQLKMLDNLRSTRASGRVVLQIGPDDRSIDDLPDIPLEDGDRITIPQRLEMVHVIGAVYRQSSYVYVGGTNVRHYLRLAGSATQTADLKHALLVRADGSVLDRKSTSKLWRGGFYDVRVLPGDTLVIPTKLVTGAFQRNLRDWTQIASQLAITGASLAVVSGY